LNLNLPSQGRRTVLVTAHRRESFGVPFESICLALRDLADRNSEVQLVYPVHLNPNVQEPVMRYLSGHPRILLIEPLRYEQFVHLMSRCDLILTDSGGIQEEATALGKPTLVMRSTTERPEAMSAGNTMLVGTDRERIVSEAERLLRDEDAYRSMAGRQHPFGDGYAARRILDILASLLAR
jgi:UDP-N-acetylglucosamine 2-epimerase